MEWSQLCHAYGPLCGRFSGGVRDLEDNLTERIAKAHQQHTWLGEVEELRQTLTALRKKKQHAERFVHTGIADVPHALD